MTSVVIACHSTPLCDLIHQITPLICDTRSISSVSFDEWPFCGVGQCCCGRTHAHQPTTPTNAQKKIHQREKKTQFLFLRKNDAEYDRQWPAVLWSEPSPAHELRLRLLTPGETPKAIRTTQGCGFQRERKVQRRKTLFEKLLANRKVSKQEEIYIARDLHSHLAG